MEPNSYIDQLADQIHEIINQEESSEVNKSQNDFRNEPNNFSHPITSSFGGNF
jgi:hypothetical protein